jgi:hypothetical protein
VTRLGAADVSLIAAIDRSEHVDVQYAVVDGQLVEAPVVIAEVPGWDPAGNGPHSVGAHVDFCAPVLARGGVLLGAFDEGEQLAGLSVIEPAFEPALAWLAFLHVRGGRNVDVRVGDTDRIRDRLLPRPRLSPRRPGPPAAVRGGARGHPPRLLPHVMRGYGRCS